MTTSRNVQRLPSFLLTIGKMKIWTIICKKACIDKMKPINLADRLKPPENLKGNEGSVSDFPIANRTGRSCSAQIV